jgi:hypothetical protein
VQGLPAALLPVFFILVLRSVVVGGMSNVPSNSDNSLSRSYLLSFPQTLSFIMGYRTCFFANNTWKVRLELRIANCELRTLHLQDFMGAWVPGSRDVRGKSTSRASSPLSSSSFALGNCVYSRE